MKMYSALVLEHFEHPRNAGTVDGADAAVRVENPACGVVLELALKLAGERIAEIRFRAKGCVHLMLSPDQVDRATLLKALKF